MIAQGAFAGLSACLLGAGFMAVASRNLVHSVLWLALSLAATAGLYALLDAGFIAAIQIILYTGGVITLMLFGVMLTDQGNDSTTESLDKMHTNKSRRRLPAALVATVTFGLLAASLWQGAPRTTPATGFTTGKQIGASFLTTHLLAFEVLSVLLLAAMVGAIVIARRRDP